MKIIFVQQRIPFHSFYFMRIFNTEFVSASIENDTQFIHRQFQWVRLVSRSCFVPNCANVPILFSIFYFPFVICVSDIFLEKHWRSVVSRSVCDYFLDAQRATPNVSVTFLYVIDAEKLSLIQFIFFPFKGCCAGHTNATLLFDINPTRKYFIGGRVQTRDSTTFCHRIFASRRRHIPGLFYRMLRIDNQRELCCRLRVAR